MARNRVLRTTKYKLSEIQEKFPDQFLELSELFVEFERYKTSLVEEYRKVAEAISDLDISKAMATKSMGKFLRQAGDSFPLVKTEPQWWIYRNKDGEIMLESAFSERDYRNASRANKASLSREVQSEDGADLFESEEGETDTHDPLGF
jgi:hypothetical protein